MDGVNRLERRKSLTERLGLKNIACCGAATWGIRPSTISVQDDDDEEGPIRPDPDPSIEPVYVIQPPPGNTLGSGCLGQPTAAAGMNLAAALAAEREYRAAQDSDSGSPSPVRPAQPNSMTEPGTPSRMSLLRLLEETDGGDGERDEIYEKEGRGLEVGCDSVCCVCMGRKRGAAFIPCGHTFCRVCSREMWLNRGSCPLCNRSIVEVLDIY